MRGLEDLLVDTLFEPNIFCGASKVLQTAKIPSLEGNELYAQLRIRRLLAKDGSAEKNSQGTVYVKDVIEMLQKKARFCQTKDVIHRPQRITQNQALLLQE